MNINELLKYENDANIVVTLTIGDLYKFANRVADETVERFQRCNENLCKKMEKSLFEKMEEILITPKNEPHEFDFNGVLSYINRLGYKFSKSKMQKITASGSIPCRKFNNRLVFKKSDIDAWIESETK